MILQALKEYYDRKAALPDGGMAPYGLEWKEIPYIIVIDIDGNPVNIVSTYEGEGYHRKAKTFLVPHSIDKTSGIASNLLWENPEYALGISIRSNPQRVAARHAEFVKRIAELGTIDIPEIKILNKFLAYENKKKLLEDLKSNSEVLKDILETGGNVSFRIVGASCLIPEMPIIHKAFAALSVRDVGRECICLVSGAKELVKLKHAAIKNVKDAQPTGAKIVSFNERAFESYGKREKQGENSPVGTKSEFAYTTALNHLLSKDSTQKIQVGDASTVFWAAKSDNGGSEFEKSFAAFFSLPPKDNPDSGTEAIASFLTAVDRGDYASTQNSETRFYVLGLSPNASRLSIRLWESDTIDRMSQKIASHFRDIKICHGPKDKDYPPLFRLLVSTASSEKADNIPPNIAGETMRAILEDIPYPYTLLQSAIIRIRATREVSYPRAALIKACINRSVRFKNPSMEEELKVSLDTENKSAGYLLGRLFATLEKIQGEAQGNINSTIRDRFYGAASGTPVLVFGNLIRLTTHHLAKLADGRRIYFEKLMGEIHGGIDAKGYPAHLDLADQGRFAVGYYHQKQDFFTKKEDK